MRGQMRAASPGSICLGRRLRISTSSQQVAGVTYQRTAELRCLACDHWQATYLRFQCRLDRLSKENRLQWWHPWGWPLATTLVEDHACYIIALTFECKQPSIFQAKRSQRTIPQCLLYDYNQTARKAHQTLIDFGGVTEGSLD